MRGLYIHIPFCKQICTYCDFPKMVSKKENYIKYLDGLFIELDSKKNDLMNIETVYIGGGTPNILDDELLEKLLIKIKPFLDTSKESTIECNPELVTESQAYLFNKYNINRVSLGVQSVDDNCLKVLGRKHTKQDVTNAIKILRDNHIQNISCDFIYGVPNQTLDSLKNEFEYVLAQKLPHVSFYSLILEDKTILNHRLNNGQISLPDDDYVADMEEWINQNMLKNGYNHYEVSNYSYPGYESIHNMLYWKCEEYVGIGLGASGYVKPYRYTNYRTLNKYLTMIEEERTLIDELEQKKEYMMLGLRMLSGIDMDLYKNKFNSNCLDDFNLNHHINSGMLKIEGNRLYIPEDKIFIANQVYMEFV